MALEIPAVIKRIADDKDRELARHFFVFVSRFEYALKASGYIDDKGGWAAPDWKKFGNDHKDCFFPNSSPQLKGAVDYFSTYPPHKQIKINGGVGFKEEPPNPEPDLAWIIVKVRCVRNNLFHGGKFPQDTDSSRDQLLLKHAMTILVVCLEFDASVSYAFKDDPHENRDSN